MAMVNVRVTTLGSKGVEIVGRDMDPVRVPVAKERVKADPTGVGDGFRAGLLMAREWGLSWERAAQVGSLLATLVLETIGTQEYEVKPTDFAERLAESYGDDAAADVAAAPVLSGHADGALRRLPARGQRRIAARGDAACSRRARRPRLRRGRQLCQHRQPDLQLDRPCRGS